MELVSKVKIWPLKTPIKNLLANGNALIAETVQCSFQIIQGSNGVFAKLPQTLSKKDNKYYDLVRFPDQESYIKFQEAIKTEYLKVKNGDVPAPTTTKSATKQSVVEAAPVADDDIPF